MIQIYTLITPLPKYCGTNCLQLFKRLFELVAPAPTNVILCPHCGKAIRIEKVE